MKSQPSPVRARAMNAVALGLRTLWNEVRLLVGLLPRLRDAFDADELPVSFILNRDSRLGDARRVGRGRPIAAKTPFRPRPAMQWTEHRGTEKKQGSDD